MDASLIQIAGQHIDRAEFQSIEITSAIALMQAALHEMPLKEYRRQHIGRSRPANPHSAWKGTAGLNSWPSNKAVQTS
ncbi:hypothetical protein GRF61_18700 [Azoarcus sp. TTM-91]|uniref:hypothetical protein n=1 Tax=Azoarcus sp. TTM-91 TaxID=2691581 RepID=UPI00145EFC25|nr:hypothetical protein [Azoarcus sp. TTM-91]NMG36483.1 hypothetical protein [Azoarcus sp. TTM-91]